MNSTMSRLGEHPKAVVRRRGGAARSGESSVSTIDISVCIPNWNCRDMLRDCLHSLRRAAAGELRVEVVVVDNASTDGAPQMVASEFPEVILHRNGGNLGFAIASNQCAQLASGRYLLFLNNDTIVPAGALERLVAYADLNAGIGMIGPKLIDGSGRLQISHRRRPTVAAMLHRTALFRWTRLFRQSYDDYRRTGFDSERERPVDVLMGAAILMPREVYEESGGWDEDFHFGVEDVEFSVRVGRDRPLIYLPSVSIIHHGRVSSRENVTFSAPNLLIGYVHYFRKINASRWSVRLYKLAITCDTPLQLLTKLAQATWRSLRGHHDKARKSRLAAKGLLHFMLRDLPRFWRA